MDTVIAIPSSPPGGMNAALGAHFGHCEMYTLVSVEDSQVKKVEIVPGVEHSQGGCMVPVKYLADKGAGMLIAGGMGLRPLMGFQQVGIEVYYGGQAPTVGDAVNALLQGKLPRFSQENTCGGGH